MYDQNEIVLEIVSRLTELSGAPCKKKVQKIVYLLEEGSEYLGFDYKLHIYGPYSEDLDYTICGLKASHTLDVIYGNKGHILKCKKKVEFKNISEDMERVFQNFGGKTSRQLELITTTLFAERHINDKSDGNIMHAVKKVKGSKFSLNQIKTAITLLQETGYIGV